MIDDIEMGKKGLTYLMGSEFSIIQMLDGVLGVLISDKLDNASTILEDVRIADISSDSHMVL